MKTLSKFWIVAVAWVFSLQVLYANSGPTHWEGTMAGEVLDVDEETSIEVLEEQLLFEVEEESDDSTIAAQVTATYTFKNPTKEACTVQMAFPFTGELRRMNANDIRVKADGKVLPYTMYMGESMPKGNKIDLSFEAITQSIIKEPYTSKKHTLEDKGILYEIKLEDVEEAQLLVEMEDVTEETAVLTSGWNSYSWDTGYIELGTRLRTQDSIWIYILGKEPQLTYKIFKNDGMQPLKEDTAYQVTAQPLELKEWLFRTYQEVCGDSLKGLNEEQIYSMLLKLLDQCTEDDYGMMFEEDLINMKYQKRLFTLLYDVPFEAGEEKVVEVRYLQNATMDKTQKIKATYTFDYLLNPASKWADFKNLTIEVRPNSRYPFIIDSSIPFEKTKTSYVFKSHTLPEEDLYFTLYVHGNINWQYVMGGVIVCISVLILSVVFMKKRFNKEP